MTKKTFNTLTGKEITYLKKLHADEDKKHTEKMSEAEKLFGVGERTIRRWWENLGLSNKRVEKTQQLEEARKKEIAENTDVVLVTSCQNKTSINKDMLSNMEAYKEFLQSKGFSVEIVVVPTRYRNPTTNEESSEKMKDLEWDSNISKYLHYGKYKVGNTLISADTWINPTAKQPLQGYELFAAQNHLVLGHPRVHSIPLPRLRNKESFRMCTTGYISVKNYSRSKAGQTADAHHGYGFVIVENSLIPRNVKVKSDGSFIDLVYEVKDGGVSQIDSVEAIVLGDLHSAVIDEKFFYGVTKPLLCDVFKPKAIVCHDALDGTSFNPHEEKDMFVLKKKIRDGLHLIEEEIKHTLEIINSLKECTDKVYVTESNHDVFLDRHINNFNWKKDLHNSEAYLKLALVQQTEDLEKFGNVFGYLINERFGEDVKYLKYGDSLEIQGYLLSLHGDCGINGAKGNMSSFNKVNVKMIHGHNHTPIMMDNVTSVGVTCKINQHYNRKGFSSWGYAHSIVLPNGKNQLLCFTDDYKLTNIITKTV